MNQRAMTACSLTLLQSYKGLHLTEDKTKQADLQTKKNKNGKYAVCEPSEATHGKPFILNCPRGQHF